MHYRSVLAFGKVRFLVNSKEKLKILKEMTNKYNVTKLAKSINEAMIPRVEVAEITIEKMTEKITENE